MSLSNDAVKDRFMARRAGKGGNVSTDGERFHSYNAVIAQWLHAEDNLRDHEATVIVNGDRLSATSSQHLGMFRKINTVVSFSALNGAGLTYGSGWSQGGLADGVKLVDSEPSLHNVAYEDKPEYETILKEVPIGATPFEQKGYYYTENERYCHYGYVTFNCPGNCWQCPDRRERLVKKREKGYRGYHRAGAVVLRYKDHDYICGFDEGSYFVSKLPMQVKTVEGAYTVLTPKAVMGKQYLRQGEWFFMEAGQEVLDDLVNQGKADVERIFNSITGGSRTPFLPGCERIKAGYMALAKKRSIGMGEKFTFTGFKRIANNAAIDKGHVLPRTTTRSNPHTVTYLYNTGVDLLAAGTVRHPEHRMLKLVPGKVYTVHRNMSLGDWSASGRVD